MKSTEEIEIMKIKIYKIEGKVYYTFEEQEKKEIDFNNLDNLIGILAERNEDVEIDCPDADLINYKTLINELNNEARTDDFRNALNYSKEEKTVEQLEQELIHASFDN